MEKILQVSESAIDFISKSPTKYHAVENVKTRLLENNYIPLFLDEKWKLKPEGRYFIEQDNSALIAFSIASANIDVLEKGMRMVCAHTDSPTFKIKPMAQMPMKPNGYIQLNIQGYAWPILSSWFDRPLSIAGRISLKGKSPFCPDIRLVDFEDPILIIPNAAFHLTKGKTDVGISKQKEMLPIMGIAGESINENIILDILALRANVLKENILDYELYLYPVEKGRVVGINKDFIVTPRQDDLIMVYSALEAFINNSGKGINKMITFFDAEEETNSTLGGADTPFLRNVLTKIVKSAGGDEENLISLIKHSFAISLDTSFAQHPNYSECNDPTCSPMVNNGVVIKYDANMHFATNVVSSAIFQSICKENNIPYQKEAANSDLRGGNTVSAFIQTQVEMKCIDLGIATWAVHSTYECCGTKDLYNMIQALISFWK